MAKNLKIIPLGGLGEIGKNMTLLEYGRNQIIVDCGVMFPENDMYGIDLVLPQYDYVVENEETLRGIVLTHGHMDHVGGLPYLIGRLSDKTIGLPIYGTPMTLGLAKRQLEEVHLSERVSFETIDDTMTVPMGPFRVSPYAVAHSIPGSVGLVINSPAGTVVHTGDYKLDETPAGGRTTDFKRLRQLTPDGVLALLGDSTNADQPGRTPTERIVGETLDRLFAEAVGRRIIIATFSSVLARLQEIMTLADKHGRKVALTGRSLQQNVELARNLGYLKVPKGLLVNVGANVPNGKLLILSTGSQGEPRSALNRMAQGQHRQVAVHEGDTIIISGGTIPGNEEDVGRMLNNLFARGANVVYGPLATVHVSGHGNREDMRLMLQAVNPKFLIPAHGETRHLHLHSRLAQENGLDARNIFLLENGAAWVTDGQKAWLEDPVPAADVYVDGSLIGEIGERVMRDRERLAQDGFVVVYVPVNKRHQLAGEPQIISRGFLPMDASADLLEEALGHIKRDLHKNGKGKNGQQKPSYRKQSDAVRESLQHFFYNKTQSRPVILPNIVRV